MYRTGEDPPSGAQDSILFLSQEMLCVLGSPVVWAVSEAAAEVLDVYAFYPARRGYFCPESSLFLSFSSLP